MSKIGRIFWLLVYFLSPLITISIFYIITPDFYHTPLHMLATGFAIAAYVWLTYEFILTSRPKFLDQNFGMDKIIDFHAAMSVIALLFGIIHAIIIINIRANITQIGTGLIHILLYAIVMVLLLRCSISISAISVSDCSCAISGFSSMHPVMIRLRIQNNARNIVSDFCFILFLYGSFQWDFYYECENDKNYS